MTITYIKQHPHLVCPEHQVDIKFDSQNSAYICPMGCRFDIERNIPRFVRRDNYTNSFGLQWNQFRVTQLDSYTGLSISRDRLTRIAGGSLEIFKNKNVLEVGCGAGRFTEIMLDEGAVVFAIDLSSAVDANFQNNGSHLNVFICQADLRTLPVPPEQFDIVVCIGVIQHTPNPEETMNILCSQVKPGGMLLIDHYAYGYPATPSRNWLRRRLIKSSEEGAMSFVKRMVGLLWPLHKAFYKYRHVKLIGSLRPRFIYWSPVVDYHDFYSQLGEQLMYEWAVLDTHDTLTDHYKHLRSREEIELHLKSLGMMEVVATIGGNGVEARAKKPVRE
jgi:SAM-dependent methyltransferase